MTQAWYNVDRVRQPGSVVLSRALPELAAANAARRAGQVGNVRASMTPQAFADFVRSTERAGSGLTEQSAMSVSAVWACVNVIGSAIASMPLHFYKRSPDGDRARAARDEWWLFNESPALGWSAAAMWQFLLQSKLLQGDAFARLVRASRMSPKVIGLEPLHPNEVSVKREAGRLVYAVTKVDERGRRAPTEAVDADDMLHVPGPGFNGLRGLSAIAYALGAPGSIAVAADQYTGSFFRNGARPDFALESDANLNAEQIATLRTQWDDIYGGATRAWKPAVLAGGLKIKPVTMNSVDAQILETRRFTIEDIARVFGVPAFMIGHTDKTTSWGSGVAEMGVSFVKYTLGQHLVAFEQEINRKLFPRSLQTFAEFSTAGLERGDLKARNEAYRVALGRAGEPGWMTVDEVRRLENLPAKGGAAAELNGLADPEAAAEESAAMSERTAAADSLEQRRVAALEHHAMAAITAANTPPVVNVAAPIVNIAPPAINIAGAEVLVEAPQVHNHLPEPQVSVEAVMPAQAAPVVNVAAPAVTVEPAQVTVAAPDVKITNEVPPAAVTVHLPDRITETTVQRDSAGNIVRTTQVETTKD